MLAKAKPSAERCSVNCYDDCSLPQARSVARKSREIDEPIAKMGRLVHYRRGAEIFGEGQPAEYVYRVVSGTVRTSRTLNNGRRQICQFYLPGDYFGLETQSEQATSAFAVSDTQVLVINRHTIAKLTGRRRDVTQQLMAIANKETKHLQDQIFLLTKSAEERIAWLLLQMSRRTDSANLVNLPMPRQDIADHLGLTIETVSRTLKQLATAGWIKQLSSRRIQLVKLDALKRLVS
ncbi:helix-turn-helix domain-containing protein [Bradyrhizobium sp. OHSU_III]|uniref:helix-turn-helix domain-containing protein n=1 Tax=Bradyrhizobium sp. OHSU_III TaxID=1297865 RepID=UPI000465B5D1|nr:helix-turn-helix domain-containing protein [Bradyrhizobium sp. OHSU_III]